MTRRSLVLLNRFYWPDVAATAQMLADLATDLAARGWEVTVVTSAATYDATGDALPRREMHGQVRVVRVRTTRFGRGRALGRLLDYASYVAGAFFHLLRVARPDAIVAMSDPPMLAALALVAARLRGTRAVYWVQDLFPQIAAKLGVLPERGVAYRVLAAAARRVHARCDLVIALGPRMAETMVEAGAPRERTAFVHNWADSGAIRPIAHHANPFRRAHALDGKLVVAYSGNAGRAHELKTVIAAAARLRDDARIVFLFIGGGAQMASLRSAAERRGLSNVRFVGYLPREELRHSLPAADLSLVTERPEVTGLLVPSKTYGILASGRPLLFVGSERSDVAAVVREAECGEVIEAGDAEGLARAVRALADDPARREALGRRARQAAEAHYDRAHATRRWEALISALLAPAPEADAPALAAALVE